MSKKKILSIISIIFLFVVVGNTSTGKKYKEITFKTKVISIKGNIITVEVQPLTGEKIVIITKKDKDFKISKGNIDWYFHPVIKDSKISFKITKKVNDDKEWRDCCAICGGGFKACGSEGVCCRLTGNCCDAGCPCKKKEN